MGILRPHHRCSGFDCHRAECRAQLAKLRAVLPGRRGYDLKRARERYQIAVLWMVALFLWLALTAMTAIALFATDETWRGVASALLLLPIGMMTTLWASVVRERGRDIRDLEAGR